MARAASQSRPAASRRAQKPLTTCVTGATGFLGGHVTRLLAERGDRVRAVYRRRSRLQTLPGVEYDPVRGDVLDYDSMRAAMRGADVVFHTAGMVASRPTEKVWAINARGPLIAVEAAAAEGVRRVVLTSTISALGPATDGELADEGNDFPDDWTGLTYPDSKHEGEHDALEAGERHGVEVVVVNPAYVLGVPVNRSLPGETSTRIVGNYLLGRLPGVIDAPMNFVDVEDAALGHLLAAEHGRPGERYVLGGENLRWPELIDRLAELSGVRNPIMVLPREIARIARLREAFGLPGPMSAEGYDLMAQEWVFSSAKAEEELGFHSRSLDRTLSDTIDWYLELIEADVFDQRRSALSTMSRGVRTANRYGALLPVRLTQRLIGRRMIAGG